MGNVHGCTNAKNLSFFYSKIHFHNQRILSFHPILPIRERPTSILEICTLYNILKYMKYIGKPCIYFPFSHYYRGRRQGGQMPPPPPIKKERKKQEREKRIQKRKEAEPDSPRTCGHGLLMAPRPPAVPGPPKVLASAFVASRQPPHSQNPAYAPDYCYRNCQY